MEIIDKLEVIKHRWEEIADQLSDPAIMSDMKRYVKLNRDYKDLEPIIKTYIEYKDILGNISSTKAILEKEKDPEFREMAKDELETLTEKEEELEEKIRMLLIPKDPEDAKNSVMEIRAGTGGDEASIFAGDLFRMYQKFIENMGWKLEMVNMNEGTAGGF
ncbi:MAG TPA: PCRF domain-containing protein, partial [Bacteroidales bacterium]